MRIMIFRDESKPLDLSNAIPLIYNELRRLCAYSFAAERSDHTLQPTALANEVYLQLLDRKVEFGSEKHILVVASHVIRQVLVNHAREKNRLKRGCGWNRLPLEDAIVSEAPAADEILDLCDALDHFAEENPRSAQLVELHYFGGLNYEECSKALGVCERTARNDWLHARAWLLRWLHDERPSTRPKRAHS